MRRQNKVVSRRVRVERPITPMRSAKESARSTGAHEFRGPYRARSSARSEVPPQTQHCRGMLAQPLRGALPRNDLHRLGRPRIPKDIPGVLPLPKRQHEHGPVADVPIAARQFGCISDYTTLYRGHQVLRAGAPPGLHVARLYQLERQVGDRRVDLELALNEQILPTRSSSAWRGRGLAELFCF